MSDTVEILGAEIERLGIALQASEEHEHALVRLNEQLRGELAAAKAALAPFAEIPAALEQQDDRDSVRLSFGMIASWSIRLEAFRDAARAAAPSERQEGR